jgi:hypothetical protein
MDPGSEIRKILIPDPDLGGKKALDPGRIQIHWYGYIRNTGIIDTTGGLFDPTLHGSHTKLITSLNLSVSACLHNEISPIPNVSNKKVLDQSLRG